MYNLKFHQMVLPRSTVQVLIIDIDNNKNILILLLRFIYSVF